MSEPQLPRGGAGPPQPVPRGAHIALVVTSVAVIGGVVGLLYRFTY